MVDNVVVNEQPIAPALGRSKKKSFLRQKKFLIGGGVVFLAIGFLIFTAIQSSSMYYLTVSELKAQAETLGAQPVRLGGKVVEGTVDWDKARTTLRFQVTDGKETVSVSYKGVVPDSFKSDADVIVEGLLSKDQVFEATTLLAKCPSKYVPGT